MQSALRYRTDEVHATDGHHATILDDRARPSRVQKPYGQASSAHVDATGPGAMQAADVQWIAQNAFQAVTARRNRHSLASPRPMVAVAARVASLLENAIQSCALVTMRT